MSLVQAVFLSLVIGLTQAPTGSVGGVVRDEGGGVMPGATVTVSGGGREVKVLSDAQGRYRIEGLAAGVYQVTGELAGFTVAKCVDVSVTTAPAGATCDLALSVWGPPVPETDPRFQALIQAENRWRQHGPASYEFTIAVRCFCIFGRNPFSFRVVNGQSEVVGETDATRVTSAKSFGRAELLFALIRTALNRGGFRVNVSYDPDTGFPMTADLDPQRDASDDQTSFVVSGFKPIRMR